MDEVKVVKLFNQDSKGIRQWPINTFSMMFYKNTLNLMNQPLKKICYANKKGNVVIKLFIAINSPKFPSSLGKLSL